MDVAIFGARSGSRRGGVSTQGARSCSPGRRSAEENRGLIVCSAPALRPPEHPVRTARTAEFRAVRGTRHPAPGTTQVPSTTLGLHYAARLPIAAGRLVGVRGGD